MKDGDFYDGLYVFPMEGEGTHYVAKMASAREGAMREFFDPVSGKYIGCCGCNWADTHVRPLAEFAA